jgi:hypothetical protein
VRVCRAFTSNPNRAQKLSAALAPLNRDAAAGLSDFLFRTKLTVPKGSRIFYPLSAISVLCPFGMFFSPFFFWPSLALWILNIVLHCRFNSSVVRHRPSLATLAILLKSVPAIADSIQSLELPEERELSEAAPVAIEIRKSISKTLLLFSGGDDLTRIFKEYLNVLCLFDLCSLCKAIEAVKRERRMLGEIFRIVARLDACRAFSAATSESLVCAAEFTNARAFEFTDVYHPLIPNAVCNSIRSDGNSVLLSGTNMAGKTTFMKALGINVLLARTIGLCFARKAILPDVIVKTLIKRQDTTVSGQSYFFFEATELLRMMNEENGRRGLFLLDEIFRGTNSRERIAAGAAVLKYLASRGLVFASTHDDELTTLLRNEFDSYHFSEIVENGTARFDYLLRKGPCLTRNAIHLLTMAGYPKQVTDFAAQLATARDPNPATP